MSTESLSLIESRMRSLHARILRATERGDARAAEDYREEYRGLRARRVALRGRMSAAGVSPVPCDGCADHCDDVGAYLIRDRAGSERELRYCGLCVAVATTGLRGAESIRSLGPICPYCDEPVGPDAEQCEDVSGELVHDACAELAWQRAQEASIR